MHLGVARDPQEFEPSLLFLFKNINKVYETGYGNWGDSGEFGWPQYFYFMLEGLLFPLVMFNFLIAIISKTYDNIEEKQEYFGTIELIVILLDICSFSNAINLWSEDNS